MSIIQHSNSTPNQHTARDALRSQQQLFFYSHGIKKRKLFYRIQFTEEENKWIQQIKSNLKTKKHINIQDQPSLLRYYYSTNLDMDLCLQKLQQYHKWFTSPQIQNVSLEAEQILQNGFVYSFGKSKQRRPYVVMNIGKVNLDVYSLNAYFQAINYINNKVIKQHFIPGYIETYDYVLDLQQKLLSLPISDLQGIISRISNVYSMRMTKMMIVNCTFATKLMYNGCKFFLSEETINKISLYTESDLQDGALMELIDEEQLQIKYGGRHPDIDFKKMYRFTASYRQLQQQRENMTQYYSVEDNQQFFVYQNQSRCCGGGGQCNIY